MGSGPSVSITWTSCFGGSGFCTASAGVCSFLAFLTGFGCLISGAGKAGVSLGLGNCLVSREVPRLCAG